MGCLNTGNYVNLDYLYEVYYKYIDKQYGICLKKRRGRVKRFIKTYLYALGIKYIETEEDLFVLKEDGKRFKELYERFDVNDYYSSNECAKLFQTRREVMNRKLERFFQRIMFKGTKYILKNEADYWLNIKKESITTSEFLVIQKRELGILSYHKDTINKAVEELKSQGKNVRVIRADDHPFGNQNLIIGYDEIINYLKLQKKFVNIEDRYEEFKLRIHGFSNKNAVRTLSDYNNFVIERINSNKRKDLARVHADIYEKLALYLDKEIFTYSHDEINALLSKLNNNKEQDKEFYQYLNFCKMEYPKSFIQKTKYDRSKIKKRYNDDNKSYTQEQWNKLMRLVFDNIDNSVFLDRALNSRTCAMCWLYIALHFVTSFRYGDMEDLPKPDLMLIGFNNGTDFLNYLKQGGNFTKVMGDAIYNNVSMQMMAYGENANKNGVRLRLIVGESMILPIGLLLAICEAHRQVQENSSSKSNKNTDVIITTSVRIRQTHILMFGADKYEEIFGSKTFSNIIANNTYLHILEKGGGPKGILLSSVSRGHKELIKPSRTTADIYLTNGYMNKGNDLDDITFNMYERGTCSCVPYKLLYALDGEFCSFDYNEQTQRIKNIGLNPYEIESLSKVITHKNSEIDALIDKMVKSNKIVVKEILRKMAYGECPSKHQFTECFLRAILKTADECDDKELIANKILSEDISNEQNCLLPKSTTCFGCPFLVVEKLFLIELRERMSRTVQQLVNLKAERDKQRLYDLLIIQKYILYEAIEILGKDSINVYFPKQLRDEM